MPRMRYLVHGRVQGVGFRYYTLRQARSIGVSGWVRNRVDGAVEVEAQGVADQLELLQDALQRGPAFALVTEVEAVALDESPNAPGAFTIR